MSISDIEDLTIKILKITKNVPNHQDFVLGEEIEKRISISYENIVRQDISMQACRNFRTG